MQTQPCSDVLWGPARLRIFGRKEREDRAGVAPGQLPQEAPSMPQGTPGPSPPGRPHGEREGHVGSEGGVGGTVLACPSRLGKDPWVGGRGHCR